MFCCALLRDFVLGWIRTKRMDLMRFDQVRDFYLVRTGLEMTDEGREELIGRFPVRR